MAKYFYKTLPILLAVLALAWPFICHSQEEIQGGTLDDEGLFEPPEPLVETETKEPDEEPVEKIEAGKPQEGENRWAVDITGAVIVNYTFANSQDMFTVKYRWEVKGQANAATALINGDADVNADVQGPLAKWPTGECKLEITVPKVPFNLTFRRSGEDRATLSLNFKRQISEDWQSRCTFIDAPGKKFDTRGSPEMWLNQAIAKATPSLKNALVDVGTSETTTQFIIKKESIPDPPLGKAEIEGTGVITITPGGGE